MLDASQIKNIWSDKKNAKQKYTQSVKKCGIPKVMTIKMPGEDKRTIDLEVFEIVKQ